MPSNRIVTGVVTRIFDVGHVVELDVRKLAADLLHLADVHRLHDVARRGVDGDLAARAHPRQALRGCDELVRVGAAAGLLQYFGDERHAVVARDRHEVRTVLRIGLRIGGGVRLVLGRVVHVRVVERCDDAEHRVSVGVEDVLVREVARGDDPDARLRQSAVDESLHERDGFGARRHEQEHGVGLRILDFLQVRREVRVLDRHAHLADHLPSGARERLLELRFGVMTRTEVGDERVRFLDAVLGGPGRDRRRILRQGVRHAHDVRRTFGDDRRGGVHDNHRLLRLGGDGRDRQRRGR